MPPHVTRLEPAFFGRGCETLTAAFERDPMSDYLFPGPRGRRRGLSRMFSCELCYGLRQGEVDTAGRGDGLAIWFGPSHSAGAVAGLVRSGAWRVPLTLGLRGTVRLLVLLRSIQVLHQRVITQPHWYLLGLAVHPDCQGKGLGATLVNAGAERARSGGWPCYLETTNPKNVAYYQNHGFKLVRSGEVPRGGPTLWGLVRNPAR